jgi:hypothetical protein
VREQALELVPELGPSFEEAKEEKAQTEEQKKKKRRTRENNSCSWKLRKNQTLDSRASQGLWSEPVGPFIFGIRNCTSFGRVPYVQASEEAEQQNKEKQQKPVVKRTVQRQLRKSGCNRTRKRASRDKRHNLAYI